MIKYYCDKCKKEMYAHKNIRLDNTKAYMLCFECFDEIENLFKEVEKDE